MWYIQKNFDDNDNYMWRRNVIKYSTIKIICDKTCDTVISTEYLYISFPYIIGLSMSCHHTKVHNGNNGLPFLCYPWCWVHCHGLSLYIYMSVNGILLCMPSKIRINLSIYISSWTIRKWIKLNRIHDVCIYRNTNNHSL